MDFNDIRQKLKALRDRIQVDGGISNASEAELRAILNDTLITASDELTSIQKKLTATMAVRAGNDNALSEEQKKRLRIVEKTGTGSLAVH